MDILMQYKLNVRVVMNGGCVLYTYIRLLSITLYSNGESMVSYSGAQIIPCLI